METTDKTNMYSNALRFDIMEIKEPNKVLLFDYKPMTDIMSVVGDDFDKFKISPTSMVKALVGIATAITASSWIMNLIAPITFAQGLTAIFIAGTFTIISFFLEKIIVGVLRVLNL
jgi:hypothetical protein